jgi:hypothetical protein
MTQKPCTVADGEDLDSRSLEPIQDAVRPDKDLPDRCVLNVIDRAARLGKNSQPFGGSYDPVRERPRGARVAAGADVVADLSDVFFRAGGPEEAGASSSHPFALISARNSS